MPNLLKTSIAIGSVLAAMGAHAAETFPNRPLRMIIPFPPGGGTDIMGRIVAQRLTDALGMQVVVDNRGGAGGLIGIGPRASRPTERPTSELRRRSTSPLDGTVDGTARR